MSKEEILVAIQSCSQKLGRVPTRRELEKMNAVRRGEIDRRFGSFGRAVLQAGLQPDTKHRDGIGRGALLEDWAAVARRLGKAPTRFEYIAEGRYSSTPFDRTWKRWSHVAADFCRYAGEAPNNEWEDVVKLAEHRSDRSERSDRSDLKLTAAKKNEEDGMIKTAAATAGVDQQEPGVGESAERDANKEDGVSAPEDGCSMGVPESLAESTAPSPRPLWGLETREASLLRRKRTLLRDRPVYGAPAQAGWLAHAPLSEAGVAVAFGMMADLLGMQVVRVQTEFPDCEVLCEMEPGKWQRLRVEFEFESRNFVRHGHDADGCDIIVCWVHNWTACPARIEVVELSRLMGMR